METPSRELYWNIPSHWFMYILAAVMVGVIVWAFYRRVKLWRLGAELDVSDNRGQRFWGAFKEAISQKRVVRKKGPGIMHLFMFWGMAFLLIATLLCTLQDHFGIPILTGDFYLYFMSLAIDLAGIAAIIGVTVLLIRRISKVNSNLETHWTDFAVPTLFLIILVTGFVVEGLRMAGTNDPWAVWSPGGLPFMLLFQTFTPEQISLTHQILWWSHMVLAFAFIASFAYSKMVHAVFIPANYYFRSLEPKGTVQPIDFEDEDLESMGVRTLEEFTWKDLFDSQACIRCGRCQEVCPAYNSGKPLSPKELIVNIDEQNHKRGKVLLSIPEDKRTEEQIALLEEPAVGVVLSEDALWDCTTCRACSDVCPARIEHPEKIVKMRTYQVSMESAFPKEAQATFRNMETNGNPWGIGWQKRADWTDGLDVPTLDENPDAEYLYWPGCSGAFDSRSRKVSTALVELMKQAGVNFAILGNAEKCCGDSARRLGNEYLYYQLAYENVETLNAYGVKKIVTQCPHCLHALSVDYPQMGGNFEVIHHSELLARLIAEGKLEAGASKGLNVTYHDSCYLGRYHDVFDEPRAVIAGAGAKLTEMEKSGSDSFCCGAGGGHMWLEEQRGERINNIRAQQALETGADTICTACPFCLTMLSDGVAAAQGGAEVRDIAEILVSTPK